MYSTRRIGVTIIGAACAALVFGYARWPSTAAASGLNPSLQNGGGKVLARMTPPQPIALNSPNTTIHLPLTQQANAAITQAAEGKTTRLFLNVVGITYRQNPGAGFEIYLNPPGGAVPDRGSAHYAGVLHFYGLKEAAEASGKPAEVSFEISDQVRQLIQLHHWPAQELSITFVRRGALDASGHETSTQSPESIPSISALEIVAE